MHKGQRIKRKQIVLWASNKDGGAHVDSKLPKAYESLLNAGDVVEANRETGEEIARKRIRISRSFAPSCGNPV